MVAIPIRVIAGILAVTILASPSVWAQSASTLGSETPAPSATETQAPEAQIPAPPPAAATPAAETPAAASPPQTAPIFRAEQLDQLLAPIALYPDALLAQILMAATYPLELVKAHRWSQDPRHAALSGDELAAALEAERWDPSVKALVPFPQILRMLDGNLDWTERLGDAFLAQQADVIDTVQRLRHEAAAAGTLWSNAQQKVTTEGQGIVIAPASPEFIYPPVYNPAVVYGPWPYPDYPPLDLVPPDYDVGFALPFGIGFGVGFAVVRPLWRWCAFDWGQRRIQLDVDRANAADRTGPGQGSATWQHNPAHRRGVPYPDAGSRERFGVSRTHAASLVAFPRVDIPNTRVAAPTILSKPAPRAFAPAWRGPMARIQQGRSIAGRQIMMPQMVPRQPVTSMMPRTFAPLRAAPQSGGPRFDGTSHR